ncbi:hypothetical protein ACF07V_36415 [Streptomyces sp. NPDC015661]|uniref:hypothetical protein n=1 Tax=Streptomyces sp. NPDC015661 TaxID=3364961 RepID=UPI00370332A9
MEDEVPDRNVTVEQRQKPMSIVITAGQWGDSPQFEVGLSRVRVPRLGVGRPRTRPNRVRADKAYASRQNRAHLRRRGIRRTIPDKADQARNRRNTLPWRSTTEVRPGGLQASARGRVRRQSPREAPRCGHEVDKLAARYEATVLVAAVNEWL